MSSTATRCLRRLSRLRSSVILPLLMLLSVGSIAAAQQARDRIIFVNGEVLNGRLLDSTLRFSTNYGDIRLPPSAIRRIEHRGDVERLETFDNETISGHLMNDALQFDIGGGTLDVRKERVDKVVLAERGPAQRLHRSYFQMQNGDVFYGRVTNPSFALTATYGAVDIPFENIVRIEELDGQTRVHLVNGNVMQGFIATNFLFVTMNYGFDVKIPKNSIKSVIVRQ